jgi:hypothetical protein
VGGREFISGLLRPLVERMHRGYCWRKTQDGPRRIDVEFTEILISEHVTGGNAYGLCPIAPGTSTCRVAALDLDSHKGEVPWPEMVARAEEIALSLELDGMVPHLFRSSGGSGIHIYLTWAEPQDAFSVREMLKAALAVCNLKPGTKGVAHNEVEIFPKQNEVKSDGYGSMFILPWAGRSEPLGNFSSWHDSPPVPLRTREERSAASAASRALPAVARLKSALDAIPNTGTEELSYDEWRNIVFALHHATDGSDLGLDLAHEFSARSTKYDSDFLNNRVWPYIRSDRDGGAITEGTLFARASDSGWQDPTTGDDFDVVVGDGVLPGDGSDALAGVAQRFTFVHESEFAAAPPLDMIVQDVLPDADLVVVYGEPGSGKSFWMLDLAQSIARGESWRGKRTVQGRVAYIAAEGAGGFRKRVVAYKNENKLDSTDLYVLADSPSFLEAAHVKDVIKRLRDVGPVRLVVVDTLAQVAPGGAENSSEDMGKIIMHCRMIRKHTGAVVILIHHSGKDAARGARGWSGLKGAVDTEIEIVRAEHDRVATVTKQKDGEDGMEFGFKLRQVEIGVNAAGERITSCVVDHGAAITKSARRAHKKTGDLGGVLRDEIGALYELTGEWPTLPELQSAVREKLAHDEVPGRRDRRDDRISKAVERLVLAGIAERMGARVALLDHSSNMHGITS